jgi:glyoxalase family protein
LIQGLHHVTLVTADAARNVDFYTRVLGQRFVKKTVNFDDPGSYHLYYGDEHGRPGTAITFFEWPGAPRGRWGLGGTHHVALTVETREALLKWKRRLADLGIAVTGPLDRRYFTSIYFQDPDGSILELATRGPGWTVDEAPDAIGTAFQAPPEAMLVANRDAARIQAETWPEPIPTITPDMALGRGMHHISAIGADLRRTAAFYEGLLGMRRLKMTSNFDNPDAAHWYWGTGEGAPGSIVTYFEMPGAPRAQMGAGQTHHFALAVPDEESQLAWREKLVAAGLPVSPVMDRTYFKSIYTRDPDGHILELATTGPGFLVDEAEDALGTALKLPPRYEPYRAEIERVLTPLPPAAWQAPVEGARR